jgi:hypothetical protein
MLTCFRYIELEIPLYVLVKKKSVMKGWKKRFSAVQGPYLMFKDAESGDYVHPGFELSGTEIEKLRGLTSGKSNCLRLVNGSGGTHFFVS